MSQEDGRNDKQGDEDMGHVVRYSDSSTHDFVCVNCGAGDMAGVPGVESKLSKPCPKPVGKGGLTLVEWQAARKKQIEAMRQNA